MPNYISDFRAKWRPLVAVCVGLSGGMPINPFVLTILAPSLVADTGWSKADFALTGMISGLAIFTFPLIGRAADAYDARKVALVGVIATVLSYVGLGVFGGSLAGYVAILVLQISLGVATTGPVYLRWIVYSFEETRGGALALAVSMPAVVAAIGSPLLASLIQNFGWRAGSFVMAAYAACAGAIALTLAPSLAVAKKSKPEPAGTQSGGFRTLFASRTFRILCAATVLVSLPQALTNSQLALVLAESGMPLSRVGGIVSLFAIGVIVGRILAGLALDRFPTEWVAMAGLSLPGVGMLLIASPWHQPFVLAAATVMIGLATGAEGDVLAYILVRQFGTHIFGTALGLIFASISAAAMVGAILLSMSIRLTGTYSAFLVLGGILVIIGSMMFLLLRGRTTASQAAGSETYASNRRGIRSR